MARIRVNPGSLQQSSGEFKAIAGDIHKTGDDVWRSAGSAPSYDGQFGPKVRAIARAALARAQKHDARMNALSDNLSSRAAAFLAADLACAFGVPNGSMFSSLFPDNLCFLSNISQILMSDINRRLQLGALLLGPGTSLITPVASFCIQIYRNYPYQFKLNIENFAMIGDKINIWQKGAGRPPKERRALDLKLPVWEGRVWGDEKIGATKLGGFLPLGRKREIETLKGEAGLGVGFTEGKGAFVGAYVGGTLLSAEESRVIGDKNFGLAGGIEGKVGEAEAFLGYRDGNAGAKIGGTIAAVEGKLGLNVAGANVGVVGGIGLKFELGVSLGKNTRVYLGPFTIGLNIGEALVA